MVRAESARADVPPGLAAFLYAWWAQNLPERAGGWGIGSSRVPGTQLSAPDCDRLREQRDELVRMATVLPRHVQHLPAGARQLEVAPMVGRFPQRTEVVAAGMTLDAERELWPREIEPIRVPTQPSPRAVAPVSGCDAQRESGGRPARTSCRGADPSAARPTECASASTCRSDQDDAVAPPFAGSIAAKPLAAVHRRALARPTVGARLHRVGRAWLRSTCSESRTPPCGRARSRDRSIDGARTRRSWASRQRALHEARS